MKMNRVIKFRGKRVDNGEWVYGDLIQSFCDDKAYIDSNNCFDIKHILVNPPIEVDKETVGQFTGKTDDGEDDLYDGDIISFDYELESYIGVIKWFAETYEFVVTPNGWSISLSLYEIDDAVTKLGNIHDNLNY